MTHLCRFWQREWISGYFSTRSQGRDWLVWVFCSQRCAGAGKRMSWLCSKEPTSTSQRLHHHHHYDGDFVRCPEISDRISPFWSSAQEEKKTTYLKVQGLFDFREISWLVFLFKSFWTARSTHYFQNTSQRWHTYSKLQSFQTGSPAVNQLSAFVAS